MTGRAIADDLAVVDHHCRREDICAVAICTDVGRPDVVDRLADGLCAVVATDTVVRNSHVIEVRGKPGGRCMTFVAIAAALNVSRVFSRCRHAVMAGTAGTEDLHVIDGVSRCPDVGRVAVFTGIRRLNVLPGFACCLDAIVAIDAVSGDVDVIEVGRKPSDSRVTIVAVVTARDVRRMLAGRRDSVMT